MTRRDLQGGLLSALERPMLDADRERALLVAARHGDARARTELVGAHLRLVRSIARRIVPAPSEDVVSEGIVGLIEALDRFDLDRDVRIATYAAHWIRARVQQFVLANRGIVRSPDTRACRRVFGRIARARRALSAQCSDPSTEELAREMGVSASDVESVIVASARDVPIDTAREAGDELPSAATGPEEHYADAEILRARRRTIGDALASLPPRERTVVQARCLTEDAQTLEQLARTLCLSRERVRQLEARALRHIGEALSHEGLAA